jgi:hypothetical protein
LTQLPPIGHCTAQPPQLRVSVVRSTQAPPQAVSVPPLGVVVHPPEHTPLLQTWLVPQARPQPPQFAGSLPTAVHAPPLQGIPPCGQAQTPAWHWSPVPQRVLHDPQFVLSARALMHDVPH